jgi:hypothetical protein
LVRRKMVDDRVLARSHLLAGSARRHGSMRAPMSTPAPRLTAREISSCSRWYRSKVLHKPNTSADACQRAVLASSVSTPCRRRRPVLVGSGRRQPGDDAPSPEPIRCLSRAPGRGQARDAERHDPRQSRREYLLSSTPRMAPFTCLHARLFRSLGPIGHEGLDAIPHPLPIVSGRGLPK